MHCIRLVSRHSLWIDSDPVPISPSNNFIHVSCNFFSGSYFLRPINFEFRVFGFFHEKSIELMCSLQLSDYGVKVQHIQEMEANPLRHWTRPDGDVKVHVWKVWSRVTFVAGFWSCGPTIVLAGHNPTQVLFVSHVLFPVWVTRVLLCHLKIPRWLIELVETFEWFESLWS